MRGGWDPLTFVAPIKDKGKNGLFCILCLSINLTNILDLMMDSGYCLATKLIKHARM
jgi:hypothetical protein